MKLCNVYSFDLPSAGDKHCAPIQYFDFSSFDVEEKTSVCPDDYDYIIFGGGGHIHIPSPDYNNGKFGHIEAILPYSKKIIMWGVGHNVHETKEIKYPEYMDDFLLTGYRDIQRTDWVACPSCMHKAFNRKYSVVDKARAFFKKGMPINQTPALLDNGDLSVDDVVGFLGGAETVITNSYHGAYWALLLGRKVIINKPYSSKFYGLVADFKKEGENIYMSPPPKYLQKCRDSNKKFYKTVLATITGGSH